MPSEALPALAEDVEEDPAPTTELNPELLTIEGFPIPIPNPPKLVPPIVTPELVIEPELADDTEPGLVTLLDPVLPKITLEPLPDPEVELEVPTLLVPVLPPKV